MGGYRDWNTALPTPHLSLDVTEIATGVRLDMTIEGFLMVSETEGNNPEDLP